MKRYEIRINFESGDSVHSRIVARNQSDALKMLQESSQFIQFVNENTVGAIVKVDIQPIESKPITDGRFYLQPCKNKEGWYVVSDLDNRIKVEFKKGRYNETNRVVPFGTDEDFKNADALDIATTIREIGDYLFKNFKELI